MNTKALQPAFRNISEALAHWADENGDKVFIKNLATRKSYTYRDFDELVNSGVRFLEDRDVARGDIVLLCLKNSIEFLAMYFASARLGSIINPVPPSIGGAELAANVRFIRPKLSIIEEKYASEDFGKNSVVSVTFEGDRTFLHLLRSFSDAVATRKLGDDAPVCLYYSSGTTANPKGILFSNKGLMNLVLLICRGFGHNEQSIHLGILPMGHTSVLHYSLLPMLCVGGTFIFSENFLTIRKDFWHLARDHKVTYVQTVPTVLYMILNTAYPDYKKSDVEIQCIACGSAPLPESIKKPFERTFGIRVANLYGVSEAGHLMDDYPFRGTWKPGGIGRPLSDVDLRIFDDAGNEVKSGTVGEFVVKTPGLFMGYFKDKKLYVSSFKRGYFCTGDLGYKDAHGLYYYVGRKKDLIIKGGVNISPNLIDEILLKHPKIAEAASVGTPDDFFGEVIKSFVVIQSGEKMSREEFFAYCKEELGDFKSPSEVEFVREIPKTFSGKILRRTLR